MYELAAIHNFMSLKSLNSIQWPVNNLVILCTKQLTVVHQTLFLIPQEKTEKSGPAMPD